MTTDDGGGTMTGTASWDFNGRTVVVTAAASVRGRAQVRAFAGAGATVFACDPSAEALDALVVGDRAIHAVTTAFTVEEDAAALAAAVQAATQRLDVLVVNDRPVTRTPLVEIEENGWDTVIDGNVTGLFLVASTSCR